MDVCIYTYIIVCIYVYMWPAGRAGGTGGTGGRAGGRVRCHTVKASRPPALAEVQPGVGSIRRESQYN